MEPINCTNQEASTYLLALEEGYLPICSWDTPQLEQSKSISIANKCYQQGKKTVCFHGFPSMMMWQASTEPSGEEKWTSSLEDFRAKILASLEKEKELTESDLPSGAKWQESQVRYDPNTSSWKTHQCLFQEDLPESSVTLPKWGMMQDGVLWELTMSEPLTNVSASGLWPTPTTQEIEHPNAKITKTGRRLSKNGITSHSLNLADKVKMTWPTPTARDYKGANAPEGLTRNDGKSRMDQLPNAVAHNPKQKVEGQLSPSWVEWVMGWPIEWTSLEPMKKLRWLHWKRDPGSDGRIPRTGIKIPNRIARIKALGNGQVPLCAKRAWEILKLMKRKINYD